jgi:type IV pilus assembly protein PilE
MQTKAQRRAQAGFTLVELMITVAIVAILGTIAVNSYRSSVLRANRAEAKSALLRLQAAQEKYYLSLNTYAPALADLKMTVDTERRLFTLQLATDADGQGYTATASAAGSQVADAECPNFSIDETGTKTPSAATSACWR